jgi:hypothetical protein
MALTEIVIPLLGAGVAVLSTLIKNWHARKSNSEIVINLGNGSKITVDGTEESREKIRKILSESFDPTERVEGKPLQQTVGPPEEKKEL